MYNSHGVSLFITINYQTVTVIYLITVYSSKQTKSPFLVLYPNEIIGNAFFKYIKKT